MTSFDKYTPEYGYIPELYIFFFFFLSGKQCRKKEKKNI